MGSGSGQGTMSISMKLIRLLIVLLNIAFIVVGLILLAIGVYVVKDPKLRQLRPLLNPEITTEYSQSFSNIEIFAIVIIAIGSTLLILGFLGCCGAVKGFRFLHLLYAIIIGIIILVEIALGVAFVAYQKHFRDELVGRLQESIGKYYVGTPVNNATSSNPVSLAWDFTQFNLQCCGAVSQGDFARATGWNRKNPYQDNSNLTVPLTCCPTGQSKSWTELPSNFAPAVPCATTGTNAYARGCYDRLIDLIAKYKQNFIIGAIIVGVVEILAFLFAILLYCRREDYKTL